MLDVVRSTRQYDVNNLHGVFPGAPRLVRLWEASIPYILIIWGQDRNRVYVSSTLVQDSRMAQAIDSLKECSRRDSK